MFVLDTNVVSELMRDPANPQVIEWVAAQSVDDLFVTAISEAEIRVGIARLPAGRRRRSLGASADGAFGGFFLGRVLLFDREAALEYASVEAERRAAGRPIGIFDGLIAATARAHGAAIATRDVGGFEGLGIELVNPWEGAGAVPR